ncbi:MAG: O-antigen ligase family protein [Pirellulaceae bacterium]
MALKTLLFVGLFAAACIGAFYSPIWPLLGYVGHYCVGPERQWWHAPVRFLGIRYSFTLAALTALSMALHSQDLRYGRSQWHAHEKLLLWFLLAVWVASVLGSETVGRYTSSRIDHPSVKFTKVVVFTLMMTHVATNLKNLNRLIWVMISGATILGMQAWSTPQRSFISGRLERVGGPDFGEANFFAAFMACMLWIIGMQFMRSDWKGKVLCFIAGGFTANAVILTRSRGAMVGLGAGACVALLMVPKRFRTYLVIGMVLAGIGFLRLSDERFLTRTMTIFADSEERDASANSRLVLAKAGLRMWQDHPLGVGAGNFYQNVGTYLPNWPGTDAHNTYIRCLTEVGIQGLVLFLALIASAFLMLYRMRHDVAELPRPDQDDVILLSYGMTCTIATMAACFLTISLTYVEFIWWFLMLPVCLSRTIDNLRADASAIEESSLQEEMDPEVESESEMEPQRV